MNQRKSIAIRDILELPAPQAMTKEERATYRLAKRLYTGLNKREKETFLGGLALRARYLAQLRRELDEAKKTQTGPEGAA